MAPFDAEAQVFEDPRQRREAYGRMMHRLTLDVSRVVCDCANCVS
jgi:hypothetical protein